MKWLVLMLLLVSVCCSKDSGEEDEDAIKVDAKYTELTKDFGDALARKDYRSAYDLFSTNLQNKLSYNEFVETVSPYMDGFSSTIEAGYSGASDPEGLAEFVPEEDRSKLVAEYTIELSGTIEDEEDAAYFCTVWVIDENGTPSVASFYIED
jgi:hypothetical protein